MIIVSIMICDQTDDMFLTFGCVPQNIMTPGELFMLTLSTSARS